MCGFKFKVIENKFSSKISSKLVVKFKGKNLEAKKRTKRPSGPTFLFLFSNFKC